MSPEHPVPEIRKCSMNGDIKKEKTGHRRHKGAPNGHIRDNLGIKINNVSNRL